MSGTLRRTRLSVVIPAYDEAATLRRVVERVRSVSLEDLGVEREIVVGAPNLTADARGTGS